MEASNPLIHPGRNPDSSALVTPMHAVVKHMATPVMSPVDGPVFGFDEILQTNPAGSRYTVILATGNEDGGKRATLALSMACTALSMELATLVFLVGDGSYWAYEGHASNIQMKGFPALSELLDSFEELGGNLAVCSTCNHNLCHAPGKDEKTLVRRSGVKVQGMASVMDHLLQGRVVTF